MLPRLFADELWNPPGYIRQVRQVVRTVEDAGETSFLELCRRCEGAFPTMIAQFTELSPVGSFKYHDLRTPYPSPARGEWYFTASTSDMLASLLGASPLLLGTPSVAEHVVNGFLIDSSPWVRERFKLPRSTTLINRPVGEVAQLPPSDSALIDPPWYGAAIEDWLRRASNAVRPGGTILIPLMGELTRPEGRADRDSVKAAVARIGAFEIAERVVEYSTPLFEECAMAASGVSLDGPWRIADLITVTNENPSPLSGTVHQSPEWKDYRMGSDIISLRPSPSMSISELSEKALQVITLDSVSRRHPLLQDANLWSSRNRIGRVEDIDAAERALTALAAGDDPIDALHDVNYGRYLRATLLGAVEC